MDKGKIIKILFQFDRSKLKASFKLGWAKVLLSLIK